ncbi:MAG: sensor histidine kinase [Eubacteriales bacterium]
MSASVCVFLTYRFYGWDNLMSCIYIEVLSMILMSVFYWPSRRLIIHTVRPFLAIDSGNYWHAVWFIPFAMLLTCYFSLPGNSHMMHFSQVLSRFCLVVVAFFVCRVIAEDFSRFQEKQAMAEQLNQQKLYYTEMRLEVEKARRNQHDLKHHLAAIRLYLETDNKEELLEYCNELLTQNEFRGQLPYSGNSAADGVIFHYMMQSRDHQIRFIYQGTIRSDGIADTDLCVLLGNALDNALAGCMTVPDNRFIRITAQSEKQLLSILIQNSFDGIVEECEKGLLSRKLKNRRGIGNDSMNAVCRSYGGTIERSWDEKTFTLCMLLPLKPQNDESHT